MGYTINICSKLREIIRNFSQHCAHLERIWGSVTPNDKNFHAQHEFELERVLIIYKNLQHESEIERVTCQNNKIAQQITNNSGIPLGIGAKIAFPLAILA